MRPPLTALLVDDEPAANECLRKLLATHPHIQVIGAVNSVVEAKNFLQGELQPDVVFLDMEMPRGHGLDLLPMLDAAVKIVFVTASESYAIKAFDAGAIDYIVKPIGPERLADTLQRLTQPTQKIHLDDKEIDEEQNDPYPPHLMKNGFAKMIALPTSKSGSTQMLDVDQILWVESLQNYTHLYIKKSATGIVFSRRIGWWESILPESIFKRLGRSTIVAIQHINSTEWCSREETLVHFQEAAATLSISRASAIKLKKIIREEIRKLV